MMKKLAVICALLLFSAGALTAAQAEDVKLILATGGTAGTYYPFGGSIAKIWNSKIPGMNVTAQATGASAENVRLVNKKEAELALVQSDTVDFAFNAKETFKEKLSNMNAIAVLYPEIIQLVVRADSPAKSFGDLKGMKMGVGAPGSGTEANFRQLLDVYGLTKDDINAQYLSFSESAEQFKDKHIDAFIVTAGIPNAAIMDITTQHAVRLLNVGEDMVQKLMQKYPFLSPAKVPANTYTGQEADVATVAVNAVLIVNSEIKEDVVYNLTKVLFENQAELAAAHAKGKELNVQAAVKGVSIPFHPGAVKYYKEKGLMK
jgi:TRAP transporter TAXI family solute receptor